MKRLLLILTLISAFVLTSLPLPAQTQPSQQPEVIPATVNRYTGWLFTAPEAVASDYNSFCQDRDGFLWIGTDRGLLRFDGNNYDLYVASLTEKGAISDSRILGLLCDSKGRIWAATADGLNLYDPATDTFDLIELPTLNFYGYIIAVSELSDGTIIFIVSGVGLYVINEGNGVPEAVRYLPNIEEEKNYNTLLCAKDGKIYTGTPSGAVCMIEPNGRPKVLKVSDNYVSDLAFDGAGNVLVADVNSIYRINVKEGYSVTKLQTPESLHISRLSTERNGTVYLGTYGKGLWCVPPDSEVVRRTSYIYSPFLSLQSANIGAVYCSPDRNVWLGCNYYGLVMVPDTALVFSYRRVSDLFPDFTGGINALTTWRENVIVGIDKNRIALVDPNGTMLTTVTIPGSGSLNSMTVMDGNKLIVGMANDGLYEVSLPDGAVKRLLTFNSTFPHIFAAQGLGDEIFVAIHGVGVMRYNRKTGEQSWLPIDWDSGRLTNSYVASMCRTSDDKVWMGLFGGLACYDLKGDSLMVVDQTPFLSGTCYSIEETGKGELALGTSHGLITLNTADGSMKKYTTADGLVDNYIREITPDRKGGLWIATPHGLSYRTPDDSTFVSFHGGYGLVENDFRHISPTGSGHRIYASSNLGVTSFSPDILLTPGFGSDIKISGIYLNGRRLSPSEHLTGRELVKGNPMRPEALYLPYKSNALTLRLTTMDFRDASNLQYRWRLKGYSNDWNTTAPGDALIYLPHLDPGRYYLTIQAMENGLLSDPLEFTIHISPPWYLSWWAKALYWLVIVALLVLLFLVWKRKRQAQEDDARIKFFMDISHDIRSPITLIMSPLESLMREPFNQDVKLKLKTMHRNSQRILSLVNQLLEVRKLEKGKMRLSCRPTDMNLFVSELVEMFKPQAQEKDLVLTFEAGENLPEIWVDRVNFDKILVNLISNAIKYTPEGGSIVVRTSLADNPEIGEAVEVSVVDSGIGLDAKTEQRLFERFYQGREDSGASKSGFGIGLDLCRRLVDFHHGRITGANRSDGVRGSIFTVSLPVSTDAYAPDELTGTRGGEQQVVRDVILPAVTPMTDDPVRPQKSNSQKTILVVDDDSELRDYICSHFSRHFKVKSAADGGEALRMIADNAPDLIVSDVMMPGVDGLTLLHRLKKNADTHHIPVVLLSSKQDIADRMAGWDRGADGYVGKPFHIEELEALVENLIDNRLRMKGKFSGAQDTEGKISAPEMKGNDEALMERVMKIIDQNIEDPKLNVEKLASDVGLSRAHLHRKMKDMVGMTPSDFIRTIRMRRACELLKKGDVAVTLVAYKVGFTSQPHFSTIFKNFTGFTPSEYRDRSEAGDLPEKMPGEEGGAQS